MADVDQPLTIPAAVEHAARHFSGRPAYIEPAARRSVTWGELHRLVQETAAGLVALGLARGDRVAICAENSIDWIVAYLATVTAGGVGVLVYYDLKAAEIGDQVGRPACRFLVASESVLAKLPDLRGVETVIVVGGAEAQGRRKETLLPFAEVASRATPESRATLASGPYGSGQLEAAGWFGRRVQDQRDAARQRNPRDTRPARLATELLRARRPKRIRVEPHS